MNIVLKFLASIGALSGDLVRELQQVAIRLNTWGSKEHNSDGTHAAITATAIALTTTTQTTVGAAGGASALPATPTGYVTVTINGTEYVIPYYAQS